MKKCFVCGMENSVIDFDNESYKKCFLKWLFRREKNFAHSEVRFCLDSIGNFGYHSSCYKKITVLSKKYNEEFTQFCKKQDVPTLSKNSEQQMEPSSSQDSVEPSMSTTDVHLTGMDILDSTVDLQKIPCVTSMPQRSSEADVGSSSMTPDQAAHSDSIKLGETSSRLEPAVDPASDEAPPSQPSITNKEVVCVFCNYSRKKVSSRKKLGSRWVYVIFPKSEETVTKLKKIALTLDDSQLLEKLENQTVAYHSNCFSAYQVRMKRQTEEHVDCYWHQTRELHKLAFDALSTFIEDEIINKHKVMYVTQLCARYKALLLEFAEGKKRSEDFTFYRSEYLEKKISKAFGDRLAIQTSTGPHNKKIIYLYDMDVSTLATDSVKL